MSENNDFDDIKGPTLYLVAVNVLFYLITSIVGQGIIYTGNNALFIFGFSLFGFTHLMIWTPITSLFTHSSIAHIGSNMIFLLVYGFKLEENGYSYKPIIYTYLITGIIAEFGSLVFLPPNAVMVGASGSVFGLLGANYGIQRKMRDPNAKKVLFASIILFIFASSPNTNVFAHIIGLISGIIIGSTDWFAQFYTPNVDRDNYR